MVSLPVARRAGHSWSFRVPAIAREIAVKLMRPARPVLANAAQIPLTITAYGCLSSAAFLFDTLVGLASTAVLLIALEHQLADES